MEEERLKKLVDVVKRMNQERVESKDIIANLRTLGLASFEIDSVLRQANLQPTIKEVHESITSIQKSMESGAHMEPLMKSVEEHRAATEKLQEKVQEMHGEVTGQRESLEDVVKSLEEHREKLEKVRSSLEQLHEEHEDLKTSPPSSDQKEDLEDLKKLILELRPMMGALRDINEKILETNREILMRLKLKD